MVKSVIILWLWSTVSSLPVITMREAHRAANVLSSGPRVEIINGTTTTIKGGTTDYILCRISDFAPEDVHNYVVEWRADNGGKIKRWKQDEQVFVIGSTKHMPYSFLMFADFQRRWQGMFHCVLRDSKRARVSRATISILLSAH